MQFPNALDPFRSIPAVVRTAAAAPGPLAAWWFGGLAAFMVVYFACYVAAIMIILASAGANDGEPAPWAFAVVGLLALAFGAAMLVGQCWWQIGLLNVPAEALRTGRAGLAGSLSTRGRLGACVAANLLVFVIALALYIPPALGFVAVAAVSEGAEPSPALLTAAFVLGAAWFFVFFYVALGLVFVTQAAALDHCGPGEAVARSWRAARGHRLAIVWLLLAATLAAMAGILLLCVGYLFTAAIPALAMAEAYLALTRGDEHARWWVSTGVAPEAEAGVTPGWTEAGA